MIVGWEDELAGPVSIPPEEDRPVSVGVRDLRFRNKQMPGH